MCHTCLHVCEHVCYACLHVCGHVCVTCLHGHVCGRTCGGCTCMWRLEVDVKNPPSTLFHLVHGSRISQSDSEPVNMACLASQLALGIPCLCPPRLELQAATTPTWHLCGFSGPSSGSLSFMESSLTAESFPPAPVLPFLGQLPQSDIQPSTGLHHLRHLSAQHAE